MHGNKHVSYTICLNSMNDDNLRRHEKVIHKPSVKKMYKCQDCSYSTKRSNDLRRHEKAIHKQSVKKMYKCQDCTYSTHWSSNLRKHEKGMHKPSVTEKIEYHFKIDVAALKNEIVQCDNEYQTKIELGREIKKIVQELNVNIASLDKEKIDALELFENHEQVKEIKHCKYLYV